MKINRLFFAVLAVLLFNSAAAHSLAPVKSIREVDFKNAQLHGAKYVPLTDGVYEVMDYETNTVLETHELEQVIYADFNNDGSEDAAVVISAYTPGASCCSWYDVYIYELALGDARRIGWISGTTVRVEADQKTFVTVDPIYLPDDDHCCPTYAIFTQYRWRGDSFEKVRVNRILTDDFDSFKPDYSDAKLPGIYKDDAACPFECCALQQWTLLEEMTLYKEPSLDSPVIASLPVNTVVDALEGRADVVPGKIRIVKDYYDEYEGVSFETGDTLNELTYVGEGWSMVWYYGQEYMVGLTDECGADYATEDCWFERVTDSLFTWWVKVKTADGKTGGLRDPYNTEGGYGCG